MNPATLNLLRSNGFREHSTRMVFFSRPLRTVVTYEHAADTPASELAAVLTKPAEHGKWRILGNDRMSPRVCTDILRELGALR